MLRLLIVYFASFTFLLTSCCSTQKNEVKDLAQEKIIPLPVSVNAKGTSFKLDPKTKIYFQKDNNELQNIASYFNDLLPAVQGFNLQLKASKKARRKGINLFLTKDTLANNEAYRIEILPRRILVEANSAEGIFRAVQTIRQLLPAEFESGNSEKQEYFIASGEILDYPLYPYRSAMLDISRHFFGKKNIKTFIDWLALYKMNTLHLHLSDDQGWRIHIDKWPELTSIGGSTEVGGGKGGFLTKDDFKEIVQYASDRYISIVPEIDMPGHSNSALASYAFLNWDNKKTKLYTGTNVGFSTFCTSKDSVYTFIEDVIDEIIEMNPNGPYFHIGGDESDATAKKDYLEFVARVQKIVNKKGKIMIGWEEIGAIKLGPENISQFWADTKDAEKALKQGNKIIMSPASRCYLDMKYDSTTELGLKWAGLIDVDHAYNWKVSDFIAKEQQSLVLGIECPLWTETVTNMDEMEYLVFPRLPGYAEIGWTREEARDWEEYKIRLAAQSTRFKEMNINYYASSKVPWLTK